MKTVLVPLPDTKLFRAMREGHKSRTGHELQANLRIDDAGIGHVVRHCCERDKS